MGEDAVLKWLRVHPTSKLSQQSPDLWFQRHSLAADLECFGQTHVRLDILWMDEIHSAPL